MTKSPPTDEGWFIAHDFRRIDWDGWREASRRDRERAIEAGVAYLDRHEQVADAEEGATAVFDVLGHDADLLVVHLRPTLDAVSAAQRRFETTAFADYTERADSYVSVTEVSGYVSDEYFTGDASDGMERYVESKLYPDLPEGEYVSFYPMSKRRQPDANWYALPFDERAELMAEHGETGRGFAGRVSQIVSSSVGFEAFEWGVTLFAADPTDIKEIVYEMRFDEVSARYGEFGDFYVGRRFPPSDLDALLAGDPVPTDAHEPGRTGNAGHDDAHEASEHAHDGVHGRSETHGADDHESDSADHDSVHGTSDGSGEADAATIRSELADMDVYAGTPHGEDVFATVSYSRADGEELFEEVTRLRESFDHYGTHVETAVYEGDDRRAVVSIWETANAAETAAGFLTDLPEIVGRAGETDGFGTMGMFYTVKPDHREAFVDRFDDVTDALADSDGHRDTELLVNHEDDTDMFIASEWASKADAMAFFGSDDFRETVQWGRDVLADRPRHVFLA